MRNNGHQITAVTFDAKSRLIGGDEQQRSPIKDPIDGLTEMTMSSLLDSNHNMELASGNVYLGQEVCHTVPVQVGCAVVQPTYVWPNVRPSR